MIRKHFRADQGEGRAASIERLRRSDASAVGRWFWEIDKVLLLLIATLIGIGLIAVAPPRLRAGQRLGRLGPLFELHYFYRQITWITLGCR